MLRKTNKGFYTLTTLSNFKNLVHGFSTKDFGDVRFKIAGTKKNREKLTKVLNIESEFVGVAQKHGNKVMRVDERDLGKIIAGADGLVTNKPGVDLMIRVADCLPILVYDPKNQIVGAAHAGWRGTVAGVAKNLIKKFVNDVKSDPGKLLVGFGPCIEFCHYDVTQERASKIKKAGLGESLLTSITGKIFFDLKRANKGQLLSEGILSKNIDASIKSCTFENTDFYSWRREKPDLSGNFAAVIGLKNEN